MTLTGFYTGIGSRKTPIPVRQCMMQIGQALSLHGFCLRSGAAEGADKAFEDGIRFTPQYSLTQLREIYLPWSYFNHEPTRPGYIVAPHLPNYADAEAIAADIHPNWHACGQGAKKLHTRNVYQVLGLDLNTPSQFCLFWAPPIGHGDQVKGGTNTAVQLARQYDIPRINLYHAPHDNTKALWDYLNQWLPFVIDPSP